MTAQENYEAFLKMQEEESYTLGDITGTPEGDMREYTELKIAASQEKQRIANFYAKREEAFQALREQHNAEQIAIGELWQTAEDNDYQVL